MKIFRPIKGIKPLLLSLYYTLNFKNVNQTIKIF